MPRPPLTADDIRRLLALVGIDDADQDSIASLERRMGFYREALEALDRMDLGMADPATTFEAEQEGA